MTSTWATGEQHQISFENQEAWITEVGATLRAYADEHGPLLDGFDADTPISAGRGQVLAPWPNRIRNGRYDYEGKTQQLGITEVGANNASHGLVRWVNWTTVERSEAVITLHYACHAQPGWPFAVDLTVTYALSADGLTVTMRARNAGDRTHPFGMGSHPYFTAGSPLVDGSTLHCPAASYLTADEQSIPTGTAPVTPELDFRSPRSLDGIELNLCYTDLDRNSNGIAAIDVLQTGSTQGIRVWADETFPYLMVFTGDTVPNPELRRKGIAIEPMTCAPDAFNNGMGLVHLQPGEELTGTWGVHRLR